MTVSDNARPLDQPVLECRNLSISYYTRAGEVPVVVDFNLTVMPGEAVGIVGESGCGKSTVALAIMQYMGKNGAITGGQILFNGRDMTTMSEEELRNIRGRGSRWSIRSPWHRSTSFDENQGPADGSADGA